MVIESHHFLGFPFSCVPYLLYHESITTDLFLVLPTKVHVFSLVIDTPLASSKGRFQSIFGDCLRKRLNFSFKRWNFKSAKDEISSPEIFSPDFINSLIPANSAGFGTEEVTAHWNLSLLHSNTSRILDRIQTVAIII